MSAGGSLVHPEIPAILITPLCPHTLSFRPMLLPDTMELRICVPFNSRSTAWASFDGRGRVELKRKSFMGHDVIAHSLNEVTEGDHITVTASKYPFPTVCAESQSRDWFHSISRTLKWNERERQKSFVVVEESATKSRKSSTEGKQKDTATTPRYQDVPKDNGDAGEGDLDEEDEVSDEEDEKFDIDDLSSTETGSPTSSDPAKISPQEAELGKEKIREQTQVENAARLLAQGNPYLSMTSPNSGLKSGVDSPDRFVGPHPHPPRVSPRHVQFLADSNSSSSSSIAAMADPQRGDQGERDDIHGPRSAHFSTRVRIPRDRDVEGESLKTPTPVDGPSRHRLRARASRSRSRDRSRDAHRAFAVWGQDESDSAASDSEIDS